MKLNFLDKCSKIATISTCILNANDNKNTSKPLNKNISNNNSIPNTINTLSSIII